jgi:hypothetical protein
MPELDRATGLLIRDDHKGRPVFAGSCFAFRRPGCLLTAAHCVKGTPQNRLSVSIYQDGKVERGLKVQSLQIHPTVDVDLVTISDDLAVFSPFLNVNPALAPGSDVAAFGYPEDSLDTGVQPVPRLFRGFAQRVFNHTSHLGYRYIAAELSFGAPAGLSGGPLIISSNHFEVAGVVTENIQASTYLHTIKEILEPGREYVEKVHSMIAYGLSVDLGPVWSWLDTVVPPEEANGG